MKYRERFHDAVLSLLRPVHRGVQLQPRAGRLVQDGAMALSLHAGRPHVWLPVANILDVH